MHNFLKTGFGSDVFSGIVTDQKCVVLLAFVISLPGYALYVLIFLNISEILLHCFQ